MLLQRYRDGMMTELGCEHNPFHWRLFIKCSKTSLKAMLLQNDNIKPSIPVGYSILRKETYHTLKILSISWNIPRVTGKYVVI